MTGFFESLARRSREVSSLVCVGLDPDASRHRVEDVAAYNRRVVEATLPFAACYKPNIAFYEQFGLAGLEALKKTLEAIPPGTPVIGDMKRGDVGHTAAAYARAAFEVWGFGAVTLSGYLGRDAVEPFLAYQDRAVYVLCRTSNPGGAEVQNLRTRDGRPLFEQLAVTAAGWGDAVGLVVGATAPAELRAVRGLLPEVPLLIPGVGAQGGSTAAVIEAAGDAPGLTLVAASRSVYYAGEGPEAAGEAARVLRDELNGIAGDG
ncbi:MAG: orotidine-5'-phosphate decarboxylase [Dehalococcoidia bacterium]